MALIVLVNGWRIVCREDEIKLDNSQYTVRGITVWADDVLFISTNDDDFYPGEQNK